MKIFHSETAYDFNAYITVRKEKCLKNACKSLQVSKISLYRWHLSDVQFPKLIHVHSRAAGGGLAFYRAHKTASLELQWGSHKAPGHLLCKNPFDHMEYMEPGCFWKRASKP